MVDVKERSEVQRYEQELHLINVYRLGEGQDVLVAYVEYEV